MDKRFQPCAVIMHMRDGTVVEQVYPTRYQAELFLTMLPLLMSTLPHEEGVASAILSPLVEGRAYEPVSVGRPQRVDWSLQ